MDEQRKAYEEIQKNRPVTINMVSVIIEDYFAKPEKPGPELENKLKASMQKGYEAFLQN